MFKSTKAKTVKEYLEAVSLERKEIVMLLLCFYGATAGQVE